VNAAEVAEALDAGTVLLSYSVGEQDTGRG